MKTITVNYYDYLTLEFFKKNYSNGTRIFNCIMRSGIHTFGEFINLAYSEIENTRLLTRKDKIELIESLMKQVQS
jgi:DNA-directed RNA polymerase alpha subunit